MTDSNEPDSRANALGPRDYHLLVGPVLEVCAGQAASREDPYLYNDMASMLALRSLVRALCERHALENHGEGNAEQYQQAPLGACAMVLEEAELTEEQMQDCLWALETADRQLTRENAYTIPGSHIDKAYHALIHQDRETARQLLDEAATLVIQCIDGWEQQRAH